MRARAGVILWVLGGVLGGLPGQGQAQFVYGRLTTDGAGEQFTAGAQGAAISPDGGVVAFVSSSTNIGQPSNGSLNVYLYDLFADTYYLAMQGLGTGNSSAPSVASGGAAVAFESLADDLGGGTPSGFADLFYSAAFDAGGGTIGFATVQVNNALGGVAPNGASRYAALSADGRWVAWWSDASNLAAGDSNGAADIFIADALDAFATPQRVSLNDAGLQIDGPSRALSPNALSADGRLVVFAVDTPVSLDGSNAGTLEDVFVRDRTAGTTRLISKSSAGQAGNSSSDQPSISPNGRYVAFRSFSSNLVAAPSASAIYVRDRQTGITSNMPLPPGAQICGEPRISDFGDILARCAMLSAQQQVFLYRVTEGGVFYQLSTAQGGGNGNGSSGNAASISADGNFLAFDSAASDLVAGDTNARDDVFIAVDVEALAAIFADGFE